MPAIIDDESEVPFEIGIQISDPVASQAFYGETLGLELYGETDRPNRHMWAYRFGSTLLKLAYDKDGVRPAPERLEFEDRRVGLFLLTLRVKNGEELTTACEKAGYEVVVSWRPLPADLARPMEGGRSLVLDPDGNYVAIVEGSPWDRGRPA